MATLADLLGQVRQNESGGNYTAQNPSSSASGAYGFINSTWHQLATAAGFGQYANSPASSAPPSVQDSVAAYAASNYDPNSSFLWAASAPPGGYPTLAAGADSNSAGGSFASGGSLLDELLNNWGVGDPGAVGGATPGGGNMNDLPGTAGTNPNVAQGTVNSVAGAIGGGISQFLGDVEGWISRVGIGVLAIVLIFAGLFWLAMKSSAGKQIAAVAAKA